MEKCNESLLSAIIDSFPYPFAVADKFGRIILQNTHWNLVIAKTVTTSNTTNNNESLMRTFGVTGRTSVNLNAAAKHIREIFSGERCSCTLTHELSDGCSVRWFQMDASGIRGLPGHIAITHKDVSDLHQAKCDVRRLSTELLAAQDNERRRIARTIHDTTAQALVASKLYLERALQSVEKSGNFYASGTKALDHLAHSLCEIRTLSYLLHPPDLDEFDFCQAARLFIKGFAERTGIQVAFDVVASLPAMPPDVERSLFLIVQEALTNVYRHSGSKSAVVMIRSAKGNFVLEITDYGRGCQTRLIEGRFLAGLGVGIASMRARASRYGGTLAIQSDGCGTTLRVVFPSMYLMHRDDSAANICVNRR